MTAFWESGWIQLSQELQSGIQAVWLGDGLPRAAEYRDEFGDVQWRAYFEDYSSEAGIPVATRIRLEVPDSDHSVAELYGTWVEKSMYGKKFMGVQRATFIIDARGRVAKVLPKVQPNKHDAEVLEALALIRVSLKPRLTAM